MFGYVRPSVQDLPEGELNRFRTMYCGLCHTLSRRYGQAARFILNYDFTYLAILLSDGAAGTEHSGRCYTSPIRKRPYLESTAAMELVDCRETLAGALLKLDERSRTVLILRFFGGRSGREIADDEPVSVCINSYRSCGTGGYEMLLGQKVLRDIQVDVADAMIEYIVQHPDIHVDTRRYCTVIG